MKLEVGMYVRTKHYGIFKILNIEKQNKIIFLKKAQGIDCVVADKNNPIEEEVIKSSHNIIDLIEKHDVVVDKDGNKYEVVDKVRNRKVIVNHLVLNTNMGLYFNKQLFKDDIVKILTHEQFENNCYKVGDN